MTDSINTIQRKTVINGYVALINYYYIIEDSIVSIYRTTVDYLYPKRTYTSQGVGEFVIIGDDKESDDEIVTSGRWFNPMFMQSIRKSLYKPKYEYSQEELEMLGYKPISKNSQFKEDKWNCYIYSDKHKYDILSEFIDMWQIKQLNIHLISGLYDPDEYELFSDFNAEMSLTPNVTFHNIHLHDFDKGGLMEFLEKIKKEHTWSKQTNLIIINNPQFAIDNDMYSQLSSNNNMFAVFDTNLKNYNQYMEYITIPANVIEDFNQYQAKDDSYPPIHTKDDLYVIYSHPDYNSLMKQLNYIQF